MKILQVVSLFYMMSKFSEIEQSWSETSHYSIHFVFLDRAVLDSGRYLSVKMFHVPSFRYINFLLSKKGESRIGITYLLKDQYGTNSYECGMCDPK